MKLISLSPNFTTGIILVHKYQQKCYESNKVNNLIYVNYGWFMVKKFNINCPQLFKDSWFNISRVQFYKKTQFPSRLVFEQLPVFHCFPVFCRITVCIVLIRELGIFRRKVFKIPPGLRSKINWMWSLSRAVKCLV